MASDFDFFDDNTESEEEFEEQSGEGFLNEKAKRILKTGLFALLAIAVAAATFFIGGSLGRENARAAAEQSVKIRYVEDLGIEVYITGMLLDSVDIWNGSSDLNTMTDTTVNPFYQLLSDLQMMSTISSQVYKNLSDLGPANMDYMSNAGVLNDFASSLDLIEASIGGGVTYNSIHICDGFMADGAVSDKEAKFLASLKADLAEIENALFIENEGVEGGKDYNTDISLAELAEALKPFTKKYTTINLMSIGLGN